MNSPYNQSESTTTTNPVDYNLMWKGIIRNSRNSQSVGIEWNQELECLQITGANPNNSLAIYITLPEDNIFYISLVDLDEDESSFEHYKSSIAFGNNTMSTLSAVDYLNKLLPKLN